MISFPVIFFMCVFLHIGHITTLIWQTKNSFKKVFVCLFIGLIFLLLKNVILLIRIFSSL